METNANILKQTIKNHSHFNEKLQEWQNSEAFKEMALAVISGVLILAGWIFSKFDWSAASSFTYILAYVIGGYYKAKEGIRETITNKTLNVEILMILAAIGSAIIGYWEEGAILIFIFAVSGALESYTTSKSNKDLSALMKWQPDAAWLMSDGQEQLVPIESLQVGDLILVKPGEQIPADGFIVKGKTSINESAITGEAIPVYKDLHDEVFAGTVNGSGAITVQVTKPNSETLFQKIITLVQTAQNEKSPSQQFLDRFESKYVYVVLIAVVIMMIAPHYLLNWSWNESFYRAMVLLVVASPCAVVASITPATLSAISNGARNGILFKGGVHLENLGKLKAIAFDKTGTLTKGKPEVTEFITADDTLSEENILQMVASIEKQSNHPLAQAIVRFAKEERNVSLAEPDLVEDVSGWGIQGKVQDSQWKIGKRSFINEAKADSFKEGLAEKLASQGKTVIFIQRNDEIVGLIALKDVVRPEAKATVADLVQLGVEPVMLTGDNQNTAKAIAAEIGINRYMAECLPERKADEICNIKNQNGTVAMVGDGINDAPALATSNVGIAMGEGTDVALETADVVLMKNELSKISKAIRLSKKMNSIVKQNLVFSLAVLLMLVISNYAVGIDLPFAVVGHEGSTILVILNGLRLLKS